MYRRIAALVLALAAVWLVQAGARADEEGFSIAGGIFDGKLRVTVYYDGAYGKVSACIVTVKFDPGQLELTGEPEIRGGYAVTTVNGNVLHTVYSAESEGGGLEAAVFDFQEVKGADTSGASVQVDVEQAVAETAVPRVMSKSIDYSSAPALSKEATLTTLKPSAGELVPGFSPDIREYKMSVPYEVDVLDFEMEASAGARAGVNRRNLGSGGSDTVFRITVTAEDGVTKSGYTVTVHRGEYVRPTAKPSATPGATATPKPGSTPKPTATPKPSATPKATATPKPSATPKPTRTPKPTGTPKPSERPEGAGSGPDDGTSGGTGDWNDEGIQIIKAEKKKITLWDRVAALGSVFAFIIISVVVVSVIYERVSTMRMNELKGKPKKPDKSGKDKKDK